LLAATISVPALAESIATVNGKSIDKTDLDNAVAIVVQNSNGNVQDSPALRQQVKDTLINREVILQEAQNRKLDQQPAFIKRMDEVRQDMLREALFADLVKNLPDQRCPAARTLQPDPKQVCRHQGHPRPPDYRGQRSRCAQDHRQPEKGRQV
jgi:hypothetical protein